MKRTKKKILAACTVCLILAAVVSVYFLNGKKNSRPVSLESLKTWNTLEAEWLETGSCLVAVWPGASFDGWSEEYALTEASQIEGLIQNIRAWEVEPLAEDEWKAVKEEYGFGIPVIDIYFNHNVQTDSKEILTTSGFETYLTYGSNLQITDVGYLILREESKEYYYRLPGYEEALSSIVRGWDKDVFETQGYVPLTEDTLEIGGVSVKLPEQREHMYFREEEDFGVFLVWWDDSFKRTDLWGKELKHHSLGGFPQIYLGSINGTADMITAENGDSIYMNLSVNTYNTLASADLKTKQGTDAVMKFYQGLKEQNNSRPVWGGDNMPDPESGTEFADSVIRMVGGLLEDYYRYEQSAVWTAAGCPPDEEVPALEDLTQEPAVVESQRQMTAYIAEEIRTNSSVYPYENTEKGEMQPVQAYRQDLCELIEVMDNVYFVESEAKYLYFSSIKDEESSLEMPIYFTFTVSHSMLLKVSQEDGRAWIVQDVYSITGFGIAEADRSVYDKDYEETEEAILAAYDTYVRKRAEAAAEILNLELDADLTADQTAELSMSEEAEAQFARWKDGLVRYSEIIKPSDGRMEQCSSESSGRIFRVGDGLYWYNPAETMEYRASHEDNPDSLMGGEIYARHGLLFSSEKKNGRIQVTLESDCYDGSPSFGEKPTFHSQQIDFEAMVSEEMKDIIRSLVNEYMTVRKNEFESIWPERSSGSDTEPEYGYAGIVSSTYAQKDFVNVGRQVWIEFEKEKEQFAEKFLTRYPYASAIWDDENMIVKKAGGIYTCFLTEEVVDAWTGAEIMHELTLVTARDGKQLWIVEDKTR